MTLSPTRLEAKGLSKQFGRLVVFRKLDLSVSGGESLAITGPNGSGKSTLLMLLAGLLAPTGGTVRLTIEEKPIDRYRHPHEVGFAAPYLQLYDDLTARENLEFLGRARRMADVPRRAGDLLAQVGLGGREDDALKTFSSGMRQRVRFAAALLPEPRVLLLDEPGSNLDASGRAFVREVVASHRDAGHLVVIATNSEEEAELCNSSVELG